MPVKSVAQVDPNFEKQVRALKLHQRARAASLASGGQVTWYRPAGWTGDPFDYEAMHVAFNRDQANADAVKSMEDGANPGTTGDVIACVTMIDFLAVHERAFKTRHTLTRTRAAAHAAGRARGQGDDKGPYGQLALEYVRSILAQAKKPVNNGIDGG